MTNQASPFQIPKARTSADFARRMAEAAKNRALAVEAARHEMPTGTCWVLGCNTNPKHIGIIFADGVDPSRDKTIHGGMWFSSTHDIDEPFFGTRDQIVCSQCLAETGAQTPLRIEPVDSPAPDWGFCFQVPPRWMRFARQVEVAKLEAYMPKPAALPKDEPPPEVKEVLERDEVYDMKAPIKPAEVVVPPKETAHKPITADDFKKVAGSGLKGGAS